MKGSEAKKLFEGKIRDYTNTNSIFNLKKYVLLEDAIEVVKLLNLGVVTPRISHFEDGKGVIHGAANDVGIKHEFTDKGELRWYVDYDNEERVYLNPVKYGA